MPATDGYQKVRALLAALGPHRAPSPMRLRAPASTRLVTNAANKNRLTLVLGAGASMGAKDIELSKTKPGLGFGTEETKEYSSLVDGLPEEITPDDVRRILGELG